MTNRTRILACAAALILVSRLCLAGPPEDVAAATRTWAAAYDSRDPRGSSRSMRRRGLLGHVVAVSLRDTPELITDYFKASPSQPNARASKSAR